MKYFYDLYSPISLVYFFFHTTGLFLYAVFFRVKRRVEQIICIDRGTGVMQLYFSLEAFVVVAGALCTFADPLQFPVLVWILSVNPSRSLSTSATLEASPAFWPTLARTARPPEPSCHPGVFPSPAGRGLFQHLPSLFLGFLSHLIRRISPFLTSPRLLDPLLLVYSSIWVYHLPEPEKRHMSVNFLLPPIFEKAFILS